MEILTEHLRNGLILALMISLPCVITAAGVGLIIGILQAVTQVQEQTIAAAPKIVLVFAIIIFGGGVMMTMLQNYIYEAANIAFNEIPMTHRRILPPLDPNKKRFHPQGHHQDRSTQDSLQE